MIQRFCFGFLLLIASHASANGYVLQHTVELHSVGTEFNKCLVEKVKNHLQVPKKNVLQETGFAYFGTFPTHPLFSQVPVLFLTELVPTQIEDTYQVVTDIHLALTSELRSWTPLKNPQTGNYDTVTGLQVSDEAFLAIRTGKSGSFVRQLELLDIKSCL